MVWAKREAPNKFSRSVVSDSLWPHGLQHSQAFLSITNSWSLLRLMSIALVMPSNHLILCRSFLLPPYLPASGSFPMSQFFASGGQRIGASASASVLSMDIQDWFPLGWTGLISLQSKGLSQESSPTPQFKSINSLALSFFYSPTLTSIHDYWKTIGLTRWTFVGKVMSAFEYAVKVSHSFSYKEKVSFHWKSLNFMAAVTIFSDFGAQENSLSLLPLFLHLFAMEWWDWMPWY